MRKLSRVSLCFTCGMLALCAAGCSNEAVREDRSINYSSDGKGVGFQHGEEGVYVATDEGEQLEKIYETGEDTIAVSSPLWSPVDGRLIFTSARPANPDDNRIAGEIAAWDANPTGRSFQPEDIIYTCMLRPASSGDAVSSDSPAASDDAAAGKEDAPAPVVLFEAASNHPGYVAANLAVRWHPAGNHILFVDQTGPGQHSLFEFDLESKEKRRIFGQSAAALIFDWTPSRSHLVCVLADNPPNPQVDGIWIRAANEDQWWRVPQSEHLAQADTAALLERLRSTRPAWTDDDRRFAFVVSRRGTSDATVSSDDTAASESHAVLVVDSASHEIATLYEGAGRIHDLHWHPQTHQLGFVEQAESAALRIVDDTGTVSAEIHPARVRRFAGWNHDGTRLAYITPEPAGGGEHWALLFPRVRDARDHVYVADGEGDQPGNVVHGGVRITFPQWSPKDDSLSLWGTYTPTHRSWLSMILPWTLRPGDPAAILDCQTGQMKWMAVNAHEQAQVGHYYLLKQDYAQAWQWYVQAAEQRKPAVPIKLSELDQFLRQLRIHQDPTFFEYYCLTKLHRDDEAAQRLEQFRQTMRFDTQDMEGLAQPWGLQDEQVQADEFQAELTRFAAFITPLIQNAYITEVYLSLDAAADGVLFFRRELEAATTDAERFASALCLSQLLLAGDDRDAYAEFAIATLAPMLIEMFESDELLDFSGDISLPEMRARIEQVAIIMSGGIALLPMMSNEFVSSFSEVQLQDYLARWQSLRDQATNETEQLSIDLILLAALTQLDADDERTTVEQRIKNNPRLTADLRFGDPADVEQLIEELRASSG